MKLSSRLLLLSSVHFATNIAVVQSAPTSAPTTGEDICNDDKLDCQNGYFSIRDPNNSCEFFPCPNQVSSQGAGGCTACTNIPTSNMVSRGKDCETATDAIATRCNEDDVWATWKTCQLTCFFTGRGYDGDNCCEGGTVSPTEAPTPAPTDATTDAPTISTVASTDAPSDALTEAPTSAPTHAPTDALIVASTDAPSDAPTESPTSVPTDAPTGALTDASSNAPTNASSHIPTNIPTDAPSNAPVSLPTASAVSVPTDAPTKITNAPVSTPTDAPVNNVEETVTAAPTASPDIASTEAPTPSPTDYTCPVGFSGLLPVEDCEAFISCDNGRYAGMNACGVGTLFDVSLGTCNFANQVTCGGRRFLRGTY